jgi:hypothetical protein
VRRRHELLVEPLGDRPQGGAIGPLSDDPLHDDVGQLAGPPELHTGRLLGRERLPGALADQPPLELREGGDDAP